MIHLPCTNLNDFVRGIRHFYTVYEGNYEHGQEVVLFNNEWKERFMIINIIRHEGEIILGLKYKG